jgi:anti-anti-sigma regulatory factor
MLQISVSEGKDSERSTLTLTLRGSIDENGAQELDHAWSGLRSRMGGAILVLDLSNAEITGEHGCRLMRALIAAGARFKGTGPSTDLIIKLVCQEQKQASRFGRLFTSSIFLMQQ